MAAWLAGWDTIGYKEDATRRCPPLLVEQVHDLHPVCCIRQMNTNRVVRHLGCGNLFGNAKDMDTAVSLNFDQICQLIADFSHFICVLVPCIGFLVPSCEIRALRLVQGFARPGLKTTAKHIAITTHGLANSGKFH